MVSQAENAGTVASGDTADQALAGEGGGAPAGTRGPDQARRIRGRKTWTVAAGEDEAGDDEAAEDDDSGSLADGEGSPEVNLADLEQESEIAADYVEGLLDVADLDGDIDMDVEGDRAVVSVVGATLQELIGSRGEVLEALQELTRLAVHRQTGARTRIMLDVGGYRARRRGRAHRAGPRRGGRGEVQWRAPAAGRHDPVRAQGRARRGPRRPGCAASPRARSRTAGWSSSRWPDPLMTTGPTNTGPPRTCPRRPGAPPPPAARCALR